MKVKCIPILLYGLEVCELNKSQMATLDFTRFFMKLFSASNIETVRSFQEFFGFELPSTLLFKRIAKFESIYYRPNPWLVTVLIMNIVTLLPCNNNKTTTLTKKQTLLNRTLYRKFIHDFFQRRLSWTLSNSKLNSYWHREIIRMSVVLNNFMNSLLVTKSSKFSWFLSRVSNAVCWCAILI